MIVFADASAFIALYSVHDAHARAAQRISQNLARQKAMIITSNYIVAESLTVISQRLGKRQAVMIGKFLFSGTIPVMRIDENLDRQAFGLFSAMDRKDVSFVDCTCFVLCRELGIEHVFGFDRDFQQQGLKLLKP